MNIKEYARSIYEQWDREQSVPPPEGYASWVDYLENSSAWDLTIKTGRV